MPGLSCRLPIGLTMFSVWDYREGRKHLDVPGDLGVTCKFESLEGLKGILYISDISTFLLSLFNKGILHCPVNYIFVNGFTSRHILKSHPVTMVPKSPYTNGKNETPRDLKVV
ncbi:hypothetical protein CFP56_034452 [Quercus suber]|uniref:Uncharacterized protein n=1 Tax=Quercus suber TaxID=58331 RepID=A0AAW0LSA9_QUESU